MHLVTFSGRTLGPAGLFLFVLISCASTKPPLSRSQGDLVHVSTVMEQVQFSYMKGCVDAHRELQLASAFETCRARAIDHRLEIKSILDQDPR